ncbi:MAG: dockerin type I domain-containing protein [Dehalococcoidia bacterium]
MATAIGIAALSAGTDAQAATVTVDVGDIYFCDPSFQGGVCETTIDVGDTVVWDFDPGELPHTTTECGATCNNPTATPRWNSGVHYGGTFEYTFNQPGTYLYYCTIHPVEQRGRIVVIGGPAQAGDVDCDGDVDSIDAALILQHTGGLLNELPCQENADANDDGQVNSIDAALVLQRVAGFLNSLPA